jgi:predicted nucleotidyltransferase component of viral defense system
MSRDEIQNISQSVYRRLLNLSRAEVVDFNLILTRYGIERLLYRLSISEYTDRFILKGGSLFLVWMGQNYRVTRDADLLGYGPADIASITEVFSQLCEIAVEDVDGMRYLSETVKAVPIREDEEYDGIRVTLLGKLNNARIHIQIDVGFGDAVTPEPEMIEYPTLLDAPAPVLRAYSRYTMVAEKLETLVKFGMINSRMKDIYDLWLIKKLFDFDGPILRDAVNNTFKRRSTQLPERIPVTFTDEFRKDTGKQIQWRAFLRKSDPQVIPGNLDDTLGEIVEFLMPVMNAIQTGSDFRSTWNRDRAWGETVGSAER